MKPLSALKKGEPKVPGAGPQGTATGDRKPRRRSALQCIDPLVFNPDYAILAASTFWGPAVMLRIDSIPGKGRGVRATRALKAGAVIERAPAARLPAAERGLLDQTDVFTYYFADPATYHTSDHYDCLLAFGLSSLCNHAVKPNAVVSWEEDGLGLWAVLTALDKIAQGEEVTVFYTNIEKYRFADQFV